MKITPIKQVKKGRQLVLSDDRIMELVTLAFPDDQNEIFDHLVSGQGIGEIEDEMRKKAQEVQKELDRMKLLDQDAHLESFEEYEVKKIPGGTGWQIEILKKRELSLKELERYHTLDAEEEWRMLDQIVHALREAKKADLVLPKIGKEQVKVHKENDFYLDLFEKGNGFDFHDLKALVRDETLKNKIEENDLWSWKDDE